MAKLILIVNDCKTVCASFKCILEHEGFEVIGCSTGGDAWLSISQRRPDLLLCGMELSDGNALELCKRLKTNIQTVLLPIIIVADRSSYDFTQSCLDAGASDVISRSCSQQFLVERVRSAFKHSAIIPYHSRYECKQFTLLVAEDSQAQRMLYQQVLGQSGFKVIESCDGHEAWAELQKAQGGIDLLIVDINMPNMDGQELCQLIRANSEYDDLPLVVVSAIGDKARLNKLLNIGVNDYLNKPFSNQELLARIRAHLRNRALTLEQKSLQEELRQLNDSLEMLVKKRTQQLYDANVSTIKKLALVCDYKDQDSSAHIARISLYVERMGIALGMKQEHAAEIGLASMMHDVGKISVPDHILTKRGPLDEAEWEIMREHTSKGGDLLGEEPFFKIAKQIALCHHEFYDGSGYPDALKGQAIPLPARICTIVDIFDALQSNRCYKSAWSMDEAIAELNSLAGTKLDPKLVNIFLRLIDDGEFQSIWEAYPYTQESIHNSLDT